MTYSTVYKVSIVFYIAEIWHILCIYEFSHIVYFVTYLWIHGISVCMYYACMCVPVYMREYVCTCYVGR